MTTVPLTTLEMAALRARGYAEPSVERRGRHFVAITIKGEYRAEALGLSPDDAARKLVQVLIRR